jgi:hypothetical protein
MVGAEEVEVSLRIEAGIATNGAITNRDTPSASHATGISSTQFCQNPIPKKNIRKPGALFSVNRLSDAEAHMGSLASVSSAERWSGNPEPTNMRLPNGWGATETGVYMHYLLGATPFEMVQRLTRF